MLLIRNIYMLSLFLLMVGCAGRNANPIMTYRPGDEQASCADLLSEISEIEGEINKRIPNQNKTGKNVALGATGLFLFPAWFFMDFSEAEKIEINAYRSRYNHLTRLYNRKQSSNNQKQEIPDFFNKKK